MNLDRAITIAVTEFSGITDKAGAPYILHLLRVMLAVESEGESAMIVAVLHDLLEDRPAWTADSLRAEGFGPVEIDAIVCLTRLPTETYADYIRRVSTNELATSIKLEDIKDNMSRIGKIPKHVDRKSLLLRYIKAEGYLRSSEDIRIKLSTMESNIDSIG